MSHIRKTDLNTTDVNGIVIVIANNRGVSVWDEANIRKGSLSGWAWKIPMNTELPAGLKLRNDHAGHCMICPVNQMPLDESRGLLAKLAVRCQKAFQVAKREA